MSFWKPGAAAPGEQVAKSDGDEYDYEGNVELAAVSASATILKKLPVHQHRMEFLYLLEKHQVVIVVGQTGSGKTTQLPQFLYESGWTSSQKMVACTQPRRIAAMSVASHVATEMGAEVGGLVGYAVRFEEKHTPSVTRIKYFTDGMLFREALFDPLLLRYSVIMVDEAHERSLYTDLLIGLLKKILKRRREFRVIISSASMNAEAFRDFFSPDGKHKETSQLSELEPVILSVQGRAYPVEVFYLQEESIDLTEEAANTVVKIHLTQPPGDILVFLPGKDEIDRVIAFLTQEALVSPDRQRLLILPLHAMLPLEQQMRCFEPAGKGVRKVIVSTNVAETSVTIDGIVYVVDGGKSKQRIFDPQSNQDILLGSEISQASAIQRAGRAGRVRPGRAYRLYTEEQFKRFMRDTIPEIQKCNLTNVVLQLKALGIDSLLKFDFMSSPAPDALARSLEFLYALHAIDSDGRLTPIGEIISELPVEAVMGRIMLASAEYKCGKEVCILSAMLAAQPVFVNVPNQSRRALDEAKRRLAVTQGDLITLINIYRMYEDSGQSLKWCQKHFISHRAMQKASRVRSLLAKYMMRYNLKPDETTASVLDVQKCILAGLFANAAVSQPDGSYRSIRHGTEMYIHPTSVLFKHVPKCVLYWEVVRTGKCWMRNVTKVDLEWLAELAPSYYEFRHVK